MHSANLHDASMQRPERLQYARELAGHKTATDAANAMGAVPATYLGHENGSRGFRSDTAQRYAQFFKVSFEWLMTGKGEPRSLSLDARVKALTPEQQLRVLEYIALIEGSRQDRKAS